MNVSTIVRATICLAATALFGCAATSDTSSDESTSAATEGQLAGGCHYDCPKCPPNKICPKIACREICHGKPKDSAGVACGPNTCAAGDVCCNSSCGICTPPGGMCTMQFCGGPIGGGCTTIALCVEGFAWSDVTCSCEPVAPKPSACTTDADCRTFSDYCTGCDCRALSTSDSDPVCGGPGVRCFADPCMGKSAVCLAGSCSLL
jgi:hypothetical protein